MAGEKKVSVKCSVSIWILNETFSSSRKPEVCFSGKQPGSSSHLKLSGCLYLKDKTFCNFWRQDLLRLWSRNSVSVIVDDPAFIYSYRCVMRRWLLEVQWTEKCLFILRYLVIIGCSWVPQLGTPLHWEWWFYVPAHEVVSIGWI